MNKKTKTIPDFKHTPAAPINETKTGEQVAAQVLTAIRQLEPEDQNEVMKTVLKELAIDRGSTVRAANEARDRAGKNLEVFMGNAVSLEKMMIEISEKKGF